ncbi:PREDICTED: serine/arginine repetitive matrix protein 2-like isoform X2 [Branchiostoma belcheri]|uniref:Serine/arginine repetitive matrix protein 2-like isoform X2 n=1 Tax=Branchiostoma belcheri TaxID=7741 RepID=A0A6P4Z768_BRABE|nr:PREDICTED: serine/arginine repetitive matrix protein 2-like isoform X2 [Branchiostoma belcheri]
MMGEPETRRGGWNQRFGRPEKIQTDPGSKGKVVGSGGNKFAAMRAMFERGAAEEGAKVPAPVSRRARTKDASKKRPGSWILHDKESETTEKSSDRTVSQKTATFSREKTAESAEKSSDRTVSQKTSAFSREKAGSSDTEDRVSKLSSDRSVSHKMAAFSREKSSETTEKSSDRTVSQKSAFSREKTTETAVGSSRMKLSSERTVSQKTAISREKTQESATGSSRTKLSSDRTVHQKAFSREKTPEKGSSRTNGDINDEKHKLSSDRTVTQNTAAFSREKTAKDRLGSNFRERTDRAPDPPERDFSKVLRKTTSSSAVKEEVETSKKYRTHTNAVNGVSDEKKHSETSSVSRSKVLTEKFADEPAPDVTQDGEKMAGNEETSETGNGRSSSLTEEVIFVEEVVTSEEESVPQTTQRSNRVQPDVQVNRALRDVTDDVQVSRTSRDVTDDLKVSRTSRDVTDDVQVSRTSRRRRLGRHDAPDVNSYELHISENGTPEGDLRSTTERTDVTETSERDLTSTNDRTEIRKTAERETPTPAPRRHRGTSRKDDVATSVRTDVTNGVDVQESAQPKPPTRARTKMDVNKNGLNGTSTSTQRQTDVNPEKDADAETSAKTVDTDGLGVNSENFIQTKPPTGRTKMDGYVRKTGLNVTSTSTQRQSDVISDTASTDGIDVNSENLIQNKTETQRQRNGDVGVTLDKSNENGAPKRHGRRTVAESDGTEKSATENGVTSARRQSKIADVDVKNADENEIATRQPSRITDVDVENGELTRRQSKTTDVDVEKTDENTEPTRLRSRVADADVGKTDVKDALVQPGSKVSGTDVEKTDVNGVTSTRRSSRITNVDAEKPDVNDAPTRRRSRVADVDAEKTDENEVTSTRRRSRVADVADADANDAPTRRRSRIAAEIEDVDAELARPRYRRRDRDATDADLDAPTSRRRSRNGGDVMTSARGRSTLLLPEDGTLELNSAAYGKVSTLQWGFRAPGYADRLDRRRPLEKMNGDEMALRGALLSGDVEKVKVMVSTWPHKVLDFRNVYGQSGISTIQNGHLTKEDQSEEEVPVFPKRPIEYSNPAVSWSRDLTKAVVEGLTEKSNSEFQAVCMQNVLPDKDMTNDFATAALEADRQDCKMEGTLDVYLNVWLKWGYSNSEKLAKALAAGLGTAARMRLHASSAVVHRAHRCYKFVGELINTLDPEVTTGFEVYENEADLEEKFKDIVKLKNLTSLTLAGCLPEGTSPEYLQTLVSSMPNLRRLDVRRNPLTGWFAELLGTASPLQYLNISQCGVSQIDLYFLANSHHIGQLEELDLSGTDLTGLMEDTTQLLLQASRNLKWLGMAECNLGDHAATILDLLEKLRYLEEWDLNDNGFSEGDVCKIVEACAKAPGFRFLKVTPPDTVNSADPKEGSKEVRRFDGLVKAALRRACPDEDRKMRCLVTYKLPEYKDEPPTLI